LTPLELLGLLGILAAARLSLSKSGIRHYLDALIAASLVALFLITFVIRTYFIPSVSMMPTLRVNDVLLVDEIAYRFTQPHPGDIVIFTPPVPSGGDEFVKRVIGVPGDTISIRNGIVYRDGAALREPYENQPPNYSLEIKHFDIYVDGQPLDPHEANIPPRTFWQAPNRVPNGFYFVLGDNRNYSDDSHVWGFAQARGLFVAGPLAGRERAGFAGRAFAIIWPLDHIRILS
jgi:signal peptidase I